MQERQKHISIQSTWFEMLVDPLAAAYIDLHTSEHFGTEAR